MEHLVDLLHSVEGRDVAQGTFELQQLLQMDGIDSELSDAAVSRILDAVIQRSTMVPRDTSLAKPLLACLTLLLQRHALQCIAAASRILDAAVHCLVESESELRQQALEMLIELLLGDLYDMDNDRGVHIGEVLFARLVEVCAPHREWRVQLALCEFILLASPRVWPAPPEEPSEPLEAAPLLRALPALLRSGRAEVRARAEDAVECLCVHHRDVSSILAELQRLRLSKNMATHGAICCKKGENC